MRVLGIVGLVAAVLCSWGFVGATARADARIPLGGGSSTFRGAPRVWALAAGAVAVASVVVLAVDVVRGWS